MTYVSDVTCSMDGRVNKKCRFWARLKRYRDANLEHRSFHMQGHSRQKRKCQKLWPTFAAVLRIVTIVTSPGLEKVERSHMQYDARIRDEKPLILFCRKHNISECLNVTNRAFFVRNRVCF